MSALGSRHARLDVESLEDRLTPAAPFPEFIDPHPFPGNQFGATVVALSTGNVVVTSPLDDVGGTDAGAVYLFNGATGALISALRGSANNFVGSGGVVGLSNGNFVVISPSWDNGATDVGAVTFGNGTTGISGVVSPANSLVGSTDFDSLGLEGVTALPNGNYVISSMQWDNGSAANAGAVTFGNGTTGTSGVVSASNSLVGTTPGDQIGSGGVEALAGGNYVVRSPLWNNGAATDAGAVTFGNGTTGTAGAVSATNSLVGVTTNDQVGSGGVFPLTNGNYVVTSPFWNNGPAAADAGAATFGNGTTGVTGAVSDLNSLVGTAAFKQVGSRGVTALTNGNYVVVSPSWHNIAVFGLGAATFGNGTTGTTGAVSATNSLVGTKADDQIGSGGVTALANGNYVVCSPEWDNGSAANAGAATFGNGTTGITGTVSAANSLVGTVGDAVGRGAAALANGNYVVLSPFWKNGASLNAGAATFGNGTTGITGTVSSANSLVGTATNVRIGLDGVTALANGNYVVCSTRWHDGTVTNAGAATFGNGTTGTTGAVSTANSLVGTSADHFVGQIVTALTNGNYVVRSPDWDNGTAVNAGAVTFGNGTTGISGAVSVANSLVGITTNDLIGLDGVTALSNGNYVVRSSLGNSGGGPNSGAVTFGNGTTGISGLLSLLNSAFGVAPNAGLKAVVKDDVNHTFYAGFPNAGGGQVRSGSQTDGFIPNLNLSVSANAGTEAGTTAITVTATASSPATGNQTVTLAVTGAGITADDFTLTNATITILSTDTSGSVTFTVANDTLVEPVETATLTISNLSPGLVLGTVTTLNIAITSDEVPTSGTLTVGGANGAVALFTSTNGQYSATPTATLTPFGGGGGALRTAVGDVDGDGTADTVAVTGPGVPVRVAVLSGRDNATMLVSPFDPFGGDFTGGGFVAAGDFDKDGRAEFVVTPDRGGGPRVSVFSLANGSPAVRANFFGIDDPNFRGGARAALGDVNKDGVPDLAVCAGFLGGPRTALFNGTTLLGTPTRLIGDFFAFPGSDATTLRNGVFVAAGDVDGDGFAELIFGGGPGGAPRVFVLSGAKVGAGDVAGAQAAPMGNFFVAGNDADRGGVRLAVKDADGDARADVVAGSGEDAPAKARVYLGKDFASAAEPAAFQDLPLFGGGSLPGGVFVG